jgi:SAM-dependent methyltransferase
MHEKTMTPQGIADGYDSIADILEMSHAYYQFFTEVCDLYDIPRDASIVDVGCGTGALLAELVHRDYQNLSGVDLAPLCIRAAQERVQIAQIRKHDIQFEPLWKRFDVVFMTEVVEHLLDPVTGLQNVRDSLLEDGWLFLSFPNRLAWFPWFYLEPLGKAFRWWPWLYQWFQWFALPFEMRSLQPIDHAYSPREVSGFLKAAGFSIVGRRGMRLLPMLRIPHKGGWRGSMLDWVERGVEGIERMSHGLAPKWIYYRYMFACRVQHGNDTESR